MFIHNLKYALKILFRNKMLIFWTFAFPIILGTFFNMAFSDIENSEKFDIIDIAIVENQDFNNNQIYKESFKALSDKKSNNQLFNTKYVTEEQAKDLLEDNKISGYLVLNEKTPKIFVKKSGINETILKYVTEELSQTEKIITTISEKKLTENPPQINNNQETLNYLNEIYQQAFMMINEDRSNVKNITKNNLSYTMIEFYTLIAMTCLYGGILGMNSINKNLANMSSHGKRISTSPIPKKYLITSSVLASFIVQLIGLGLLFIYTIFVLNVDYGDNLFLTIILSLLGAFAGLSMGIAIACIFKTNENAKTGVIIAFTMLGCFLSGMMGITMKYLVDKNFPIINKLNPANMITDGFYALYYYDTLDRFYFNVISLIIFSVIMLGISSFSLRRQKYDSI